MADLRTRFADADTIEAPDLWRSIGERVIGGAAPRIEASPTGRRHHEALRKAVAIAAAVGVTIGVVALLARAFRTTDTQPAPPGPTSIFEGARGMIVYRGWRSPLTVNGTVTPLTSQLLAADPETGRTTVILHSDIEANAVAWSPDGDRLLLSDGTILHADGSFTRLVPKTQGLSGSFSPDGRTVAFSSGPAGSGVYLVEIDGSNPRRLVANGYGASWSPDGSWIAFATGVGNGRGSAIEMIHPDGSGRHVVLSLRRVGLENPDPPLSWAPDGSAIAFSASRGCCEDRFYRVGVVRVDGSPARILTPMNGSAYPAWSPDGTRIAFVRRDYLYTMAPDGTDVRRVPGVRTYATPFDLTWNPG